MKAQFTLNSRKKCQRGKNNVGFGAGIVPRRKKCLEMGAGAPHAGGAGGDGHSAKGRRRKKKKRE